MFSIWEKETFLSHQDVIIIGSGFTGLWSALHLKKLYPKRKITMLERSSIPAGASTRNAGFACFGSPSELMEDGEKMGTDKMLQLVEMRYRGLEKIQKFFPKRVIDFDMCGGYELYEKGKISEGQLRENINYLNSLLKDITSTKKTYGIDESALASFGFGNTEHLVKNKLEGYLHSGKLLQALIQKVTEQGVQILSGINVQSFNETDKGFEIAASWQPSGQYSFSCNQLLVCTNAFTKTILPETDVVPARGQVLVTSPIKHIPFKGTFHADEGYYYFRNLGNRILLGGARHKAFKDEETDHADTTDFIQSELERYLDAVILPGQKHSYTVEHRWAGIMAMGSEKLPIVSQIQSNLFCAGRMSGMGVALAPVVGQQVAKMMAL